MGEAPSKSSSDKIFNLGEQEMAQSKQNKRAACPKDKPELMFFQALLCHPLWSTGLEFWFFIWTNLSIFRLFPYQISGDVPRGKK